MVKNSCILTQSNCRKRWGRRSSREKIQRKFHASQKYNGETNRKGGNAMNSNKKDRDCYSVENFEGPGRNAFANKS